jgi:hypothetical protein
MGGFGVGNGVFRPKIGLIGKSSYPQFKLLPRFVPSFYIFLLLLIGWGLL